jgi:phage host-nuclease inhibitor protein Gam
LAEANLRVSGDAALQTEINNLSGAVAADLGALQADVDQNEADGDTDRALIRTEFAAADSALSSSVNNRMDSEVAALESADTTLQNNIDVEKARIDAMLSGSSVDLDTLIEIVDAYELADTNIISSITTLQGDVTSLSGAVDARMDQIEIDYAAADSALSSSIMASLSFEVNALIADIGAVQADVDQNEADGDADRALIRTEFAAADSALSSSIMTTLNAEVNALIADIGNLQADVDQNEADGDADRALIRTEFAAADSALSSSIMTSFNSTVGELESDIQDLESNHDALFAVTSLSANGNAATAVVFVDAGASNVTVTVPGGTTAGEYKRIKRKDASANSVSLSGDIEGVSANSVSMFDNAALMLVWDGTYWWIM